MSTSGSLAGERAKEYARFWWLPATAGLLSVIAGAIVLAKPSNSLKTLAVIAGIFILIDGIVELIASFSSSTENRGLIALLGVLNVIVGILLIRHPIQGVTVIALFIGIWLIVVGVVRFVVAFEMHGHRTWRFVLAAIEVIAGIVIVSDPHIGFATLALFVGLAFIINGIGLVMVGIAVRMAGKELAAPSS
jgi:uncharacterized membrane protein HdeD (DUF308 family)